MFGGIKAALASVVTTIKSSLPTIAIATATTVAVGGGFYYLTIKDGIYEKTSSNVRYALEQYMDETSIDTIVSNGNGGYAYSINFDEDIEKMLKGNEELYRTVLDYVDKDEAKDLIKKFIRAEIISKYPDLRSEAEIKSDAEFRDNELQGGIKIVRKNSSIDTSSIDDTELKYNISDDDQILTYIPYEEFNDKVVNYDSNVTKYFSLKSSEDSMDIVVAGWEKETTTVKKVEYSPNENADDTLTESEETSEPVYTACEIKINYENSLQKYSMPAGFLWALLVEGESVTFVEKLADLAIDNTDIIIEAQDNVTKTVDINVQKYIQKNDLTKTIVARNGTTKTENYQISAKNESSITTTVETEESKTILNLAYAETWIATYRVYFKNTVYPEVVITDEWLQTAEWQDSEEEIYLGTNTKVSTDPNSDPEYTEIKNRLIDEIKKEKCKEDLSSKIEIMNSTYSSLYYLFKENRMVETNGVLYIYNSVHGNSLNEIKTSLKSNVSEFWANKSEAATNFYSEKSIEESNVLNNLYTLLDNIVKQMKTLSSAETKIDSYRTGNKTANHTQTNNTNMYISAGTVVQERVNIDPENNFVTYFNDSGRAKEYILQTTSWLYEMLESHPKTANMVDLFKYLLYQSTNVDYGVTTYSFKEYDFNDFTHSQIANATNCPRYYQMDSKWSQNYYNYKSDGTIGKGGCGACALAMAVSGLTGTTVTPDEIVEYLNSLNINTVNGNNNGGGPVCAQKVAEKYGLTYEFINRTDKAKIDQALGNGKCLIFSVTANGIYTGEGHYIMCNGKDENDKYYVLESAHYYETDRPYEFDQVFTEGNQGIFALGR